MEKIQPRCEVCNQPFRKGDIVQTDTLATQIFHADCFMYKEEFIKETATYEEIVNKYPQYKKAFIVQ